MRCISKRYGTSQCWARATFSRSRHRYVRHFFKNFAPPRRFCRKCFRAIAFAPPRHIWGEKILAIQNCATEPYFSKKIRPKHFVTKCTCLVSCLLCHVSWLLSHVSWLLSHVSCLTSPVSRLLSHVSYLLSHVSCLTSFVSHLFLVSSLLSHIFCLTSPVFLLMSHLYCLMSPVSRLLSHIYCLLSPVPGLLSHSPVSLSCLLYHVSCIMSPGSESAKNECGSTALILTFFVDFTTFWNDPMIVCVRVIDK